MANKKMTIEEAIRDCEKRSRECHILARKRSNKHIKDIYEKAAKRKATEAEVLRTLWGNRAEEEHASFD